ncbi:carbohydrate ABC transporter permease [Nocardia sp. NPDC056000]|uniref:carbohydrate ABC transporter permease n=1 Tax=Nocardia sp. NPDC056000 TaxID=3345674 RepID=UPI0035DACC4B
MPSKRFSFGMHIVCPVLIVLTVFPMLWAVQASFRTPHDIFEPKPWAVSPTMANYHVATTDFPIVRLLTNTLLMAAAVTARQLVLAILAGYALVAFRFRAQRLVEGLIAISILIPQQSLIVSAYIMTARLGWVDTYIGLTLPLIAACGFAVLLLRRQVAAIPPSLFEAARMDGARNWEVLVRVVIPVVRPMIAAVTIVVFISNWNEYLWPLLITTEQTHSTIQVGLQLFQTQEGSQYGPMMAAATLATLPVLIVYLVNQRRVTAAVMRAGVR